MEKERFERLVSQAVAGLPEEFRNLMENVDVVVEDFPSAVQNRKAAGRGTLLGLYEGVPLIQRGSGYSMVVPDKITIFQKALETFSTSEDVIESEVRKVVIHEIAHHFGLDDRRLDEIESERRSRHGRP
jgi:predicted Zn-dependent protease with MMP-like domain